VIFVYFQWDVLKIGEELSGGTFWRFCGKWLNVAIFRSVFKWWLQRLQKGFERLQIIEIITCPKNGWFAGAGENMVQKQTDARQTCATCQ
jgi:hypothetical protein